MPVPAWGCSISCTLMLLVELKPLLPSTNYRTIHSSILRNIAWQFTQLDAGHDLSFLSFG